MSKQWWKEAVVYEIYPRSFNDSNGDGIGDLPGIIEKIDYLDKLGIDIVWLGPIYESPNADNGYDISNYQSIMNEFGTMDDWERLLEELHARDMKLVMDLVVNHTSDEHEWFVEARKDQDNKYRDYYIWRSKGGEPPNNWESNFGGSAWEYDEEAGEYYLHLFDVKQPDLNWENPKLREEIYEMMTWWLEKGIDGFRMDVINYISKNPELPDDEETEGELPTGAKYYVDGPNVHDHLQEMNNQVLSNYDGIMTVGEMPFVTVEEGVKYTAEEREELNMVYPFEHVLVDTPERGRWSGTGEWKLTDLKEVITKWQVKLQEENGWYSLYLNNHDQPRAVSRFGDDDKYRVESAKMLATFIFTLRGTPYLYQGEEIGMTNYPFSSLEEVRDVDTLTKFKEEKKKGNIDDFSDAQEIIRHWSRDNSRTPMQWNDSEQAGFTEGEPWINVNPNYKQVNAAKEMKDPDSIFNYYRELINLRHENPVFVYADYELILPEDEQIYAYLRQGERERLLVVLNFSADQPIFKLPAEITVEEAELVISNYDVQQPEIEEFKLHPYEARVYRLT